MVKNEFLEIPKIPIKYFQELFTELKKPAQLSFSVVVKVARTPKSNTFLDYFFLVAKLGKILIWLQITFRTPFLVKCLHFITFPNIIWEFDDHLISGPFWHPKSKNVIFRSFLTENF